MAEAAWGREACAFASHKDPTYAARFADWMNHDAAQY